MEENSISIINRTNGQLTGEKAQALPVRFISNLSSLQWIILGFILAFLSMSYFITTVKTQVVAVEVSGKSDTFQIFEVN